ncbi:MAG: hypothetical protein LC799_19800 [Actinobacteria bacterium]|nr:hypothetical protein [Actinomycetota bacterium]
MARRRPDGPALAERPPGPASRARLLAQPGRDLLLGRERKVLTPDDFADLAEVESRLADFERRYEQTAVPFEWEFTRGDLTKLLERLADKPDYRSAA